MLPLGLRPPHEVRSDGGVSISRPPYILVTRRALLNQ